MPSTITTPENEAGPSTLPVARTPNITRSRSPSNASTSSPTSESGSESDDVSSDDTSSDEDDEITPEQLEQLLEQARKNAASKARQDTFAAGDEVIRLNENGEGEDDITRKPLPTLEPGSLPQPYIEVGSSKKPRAAKLHDIDSEQAEKVASKKKLPELPAPPPELNKDGKPLTKKELKALRKKNRKLGWAELPTPSEADLPRLYREVEAMRLRNQLDPKRFYKKEPGEGKGLKGLPKQFAIGTIIAEPTPFGTPSGDNLPKSLRKRTLVDELVDDAEAKSYAKKKFKELQTVRGARGRGTLHQKMAARKPKW
ncbi:Fcf2-domain-containing protein [Panus rudis PR-1116 ss-1]|nr:Fcf2-domain-containing protein [Panus rudis PR-1116 ss-1]